ncbi:DUF3794 domain-containing protein [Acetohalobium arabaticum]|uniref:SipL SPOCS domain-containing protein n=1 Tax=Acetohalobium arabaticum (strain ATCC 49924 / DSM 5501 / Z-7288) TaxID=574087 RepID=D9QR75_ACEAZ|nr:DUF3794 domain-containing protein [Acetohalobium arabaticum]ADL13016.1 hypothetical protein Acear_1509 [Acetohalobium arabaticum DSM 5501]
MIFIKNEFDFNDDLVELQGLYEPEDIKKYCKLPKKEFVKELKLKVPEEKPDIEQLAKILINADVFKFKTINTIEGLKVIFQGKINKKILYVADNPEQSVHAAHFQTSFCQFLKLPDSFKVKKIKVFIEDVSTTIVNPRKINECVVIFVCAIPKCMD